MSKTLVRRVYCYIFNDLSIFNLCVWVFCLHLCLYTTCVHCPQRPEDSIEPLGNELEAVISSHVDAEI